MERQLPNIEIAQQYIQQINDRFLVADEPYDNETKTYNIGTFYIHRGMGAKGVEYTIREVTTETGGYKVHGRDGMLSDQVCFYLEGFLQGHFGTCTLLGYELTETEAEEGSDGQASDENVISIDDGEVAADDEKAEG